MGLQFLTIHGETSSSDPKTLVLVIEDDPLLRESLIEILALNGFRTADAEDGQTGIQKAQTRQPNCILLDLRLPDIDGFAVLRRMKKDERTTRIPVVVLSGFSRPEDQELALELGANAYVVKPYHIDDLIITIRQVLS